MKNQNQNPTKPHFDPFEIIYNCRSKKNDQERPRRKASACERHRPIPEFTMRTRKMTAEIQLKHEHLFEDAAENEEDREAFPGFQVSGEEAPDFFLKNEDYLENGIPLSPGHDNQLCYQLNENSQFSTYSKLQRALCGFNLDGSMEEE